MGGWVGLRNGRMGGFKEWADGWMTKTKGFIKKARVRALPQATKSLGFKFVRGGRGSR